MITVLIMQNLHLECSLEWQTIDAAMVLPQTLGYTGKAYQGQKLSLIWPIPKKFYKIGIWKGKFSPLKNKML